MPVQFWDRDVDTNRTAFVNARPARDWDPENAPDAEDARIPEDLAHAALSPWLGEAA